jgi:hypothetical protein
MVYRGFGDFSITVYIKGGVGGWSPALPFVFFDQSQDKKRLFPQKTPLNTLGFFWLSLV